MTTTDPYFVSTGSHTNPEDGKCAMEWVAYLAGEPHTDTPVCVSPVLTRFCIAFNDRLPDAERQKLRPYLARTIGTRGDDRDEERVRLCLEFLLETALPRLLAHDETALAELRKLPPALIIENGLRLTDYNEIRRIAYDSRERALARLRAAAGAAWAAWAAGAAGAAEAAGAAWAAEAAGAAGAAWAAGAAGAAWAAWAAGAAGAAWGAEAAEAAWAAWAAWAAEAAWAAGAAGAAWGAEAAWAAWAAWGAEAAEAAGAAWAAGAAEAAEAAGAAEAAEAAEAAGAAAYRDELIKAGRKRLQEIGAELNPKAFELLERMLPTEPLQLPVAADAQQVCAV